MEKMKWIKKGISALLALNMVLSYVPVPTHAAQADGLCEHHPVHTAECGYVASMTGSDCTHTHDDSCGYVEAVEGVSCDCEPAEDGTLTHTDGCGYVEAVAGSPCAHVHDELCGYAEAVEGQPCGYECGECAAAAEAYSDLGIGYICVAGNGDSGLGNWVYGEIWNTGAESNIMTEVTANVYEITYTDLPASDDYELIFAADGDWEISWGGTYIGSSAESEAVLGGPYILFNVSHEGSDVTLELDLTGYDPDTQTGAKFTITVIPPEDVPVCTCEDKCVEGSVNSDCAVCAEDVNGCTGREEETDLGYTYDQSTYTVYTADGLFAVAELVNDGAYSANITLAADIVLNENLADKVTVDEDGTVSADASVRKWTPLGGGAGGGQYKGTFDGGNHTITGLYCVSTGYGNPGLISTLAEGATVKNVKIHDFCLERYGGAVVGSNRGEVSGCSISGTGILGRTTNYQYVGGVVGFNEGTVKDCTSSAALTFRGIGFFGGIVGQNMTSQATIIRCSNSGTITAAGSLEMNVGGIVGSTDGTVSGCYNTAAVSSDATGDNSCAYVGGIAGYADGTVTGCYNTAAVSSDATGNNSCAYVGGIAGNANGTVTGCYNTAAVSGDATGDYSYANVGGIVGSTNGTVSGCYNIGSIDSGTYRGGIIADAMGTYADCYYLDSCVKSGETVDSEIEGITAMSAAQFASGEVAYLLNGDQSTITYRQTLGSDDYPSFTGGTVYRVGVTCTENAVVYANSQDTLAHNYVNNTCTACGAACDHSGSTHTAATDKGDGTHGYTCTVCGAAATGAHTFDKNGSCICGLRAYVYDKSTTTYTVYTADGLFAVVELVNGSAHYANITLAADIVLNENLADKVTVAEDGTVSADASVRKWMAISEAGSWAYSGTFDGGGHTITGLYSVEGPGTYGGLIEWLDSEGTVTNLKIHDFCLEGTYSGAIAGENKGKIIGCSISGTGIFNGSPEVCGLFGGIVYDNQGQVTDCSISANLSLKGAGEFGGIAHSNGQDASITGCSNSGTLTGTAYVGGIVSHNSGTVTGCSNSGTLTGTECVGGIVGSSDGTVSGCYNTGSISATVEDGSAQVGGIVGWMKGTVSGCYNTGTVIGKAMAESSGAYVGGIAGFVQNTVSGCHNTGNISADATGDSSYAYVGGIAGFVNNTVSGCYNTADVSGDATGESAYIYVGGIAGAAEGTMSGCYNIGSIDSDTYSGSIAAYAYGTYADCFYLSGCVKSGNIGSSSADGITEKSAAQFASGEVAYLLNGDQSTITFKQIIGTDPYPGFTGGTVYRVGVTCTENAVAYANSQDTLAHNYVNNTCTACGAACDHSGSTHTAATDNGDGTHSFTCTVCGDAAEAHSFDGNGTCVCGVNLFTVSDSTLTIDGTLGSKTEATEEDITVLVNKIQDCVDNGITTIIVTGSNPAMIDMGSYSATAIGEAIYCLSGSGAYDENNPYNGKIDLILSDVTEIVEWEFYTAFALNSITLPKVTTIGDQAFQSCYYLKRITFGSVVTSIVQINGKTFVVGNEVGGCDLVLNCGQMKAENYTYRPDLENNVWFKSSWGDTTWKSITLAHSYGDWVSNGDGTHTRTCANDSTHTENGDCSGGEATCTTLAVCENCGASYGALTDHSLANGKCTECGEVCYIYDAATVTYTVYNADGLFAVAELVNDGAYSANITLAADIVLNENLADKVTVAEDGTFSADDSVRKWTPIGGTGAAQYKGTFDGGNHTITGLYSVLTGSGYSSLIGFLAEGATVKNVKIHDFRLYGRAGGTVVGFNRGKVSGCSISGSGIFGCVVDIRTYAGGIVAFNNGTVENCSSSANLYLKGTGYFGGIVGTANSGSSVTGCYRSGTLEAECVDTLNVGGIVGDASGDITDCHNSGSLKAKHAVNEANVNVYVGGIAGESSGNITCCSNSGSVETVKVFDAVSSEANAGGIAGILYNGTVFGCYNSGSLSGEGTRLSVGGIAGKCSGGAASNCYNSGRVDSGTYSGGIAAAASGTFADCYYLDACVKSGSTVQSSANGITEKTSDQFASGEVAYLLNGDQSTITFKQTLGENGDAYPSFTGGTVYQVENCKGEPAYSNTNENIGHNFENSACTACGITCDHSGSTHTAVTDNGDGTHSFTCTVCGAAVTGEHTGGTATCTTPAVCKACGVSYGKVDTNNHDSSVEYENGFCENGCYEPAALVTNENYESFNLKADYVGYYAISNAGQLFWFAQQVNEAGNKAIKGVLTADIDLKNRAWTPIGNDDSYYEGIFDGSGKTIKGLNIPDEAAEYVGLFGTVYQNGHVKAVTLTESSVTGAEYVGGIAGWNAGTITGCVNNAVVSNSGFDIGGIAGRNTGTVELCGNTNTVTGGSGCGGIVGRNVGTIRNCYNTGEVSATDKAGGAGGITELNTGTVEYSWSTGEVTGGSNGEEGGIAADNRDTVRYCCATQKAIDSNEYGATTNNVGTYTAAQFASGEVAYMLSSASEGELVWGQTIGTDPYPVLGGAQVYHGYTSCGDTAAIYTNDETVSPEKPAHTGEAVYTPNGDGKQHIAKWSCCGTEVTEAHSGGTATCQTPAVCQHCGESYGDLDLDNHEYETNNGICCDTYQSATLNAEGFYEIFNAGQLYWFAQQVNGGSHGLNAKLVNNITLNENLLNDSYGLNSDDFRTWTPMGNFSTGYSGTFDGQGYVISGLYIPGTNTIQGMFSVVTGTVKNVILVDTYVQGAGQDGGLVGYLRRGIVSNCGFDGVVKSVASGGSAGSYTAGVVAYAYGGTIENCFATGKFHSEGDHANPVFAYADTNAGAPVLTNNYYLENCSTDSTGTVNAVHCNDGVYATTEAQIASVTEEQILSGEVAYLLGGAWGQTIGTDSYPVLGGAKVYEIKVCEKSAYSNTEGDVPHNYVNGFCTAIPGEIHYQPALDSDSDGFFEIGNAGQMFWFANHINTVDRTASAVLTADIDLEGRTWTPIGSTGESSNNFRGTFDGQNHTIRGLYVEGGRAGLGFFGEVRTGTVKNFTIYGEVVANTEVDYVGGVIGSACGLNSNKPDHNGATIQNITSYVNLTAKAHGVGKIGGFVGYANHETIIENCAWYGTFDAGIYRVDNGAGGFIGRIQENSSEVTIRNCGAYGTIKTGYVKNSYNNQPIIYMGGFLSFSNTNAKTVLENCLFAGKFERGANLTDQAELAAFGTLTSVSAIRNCYYLGDDGLAGAHSGSTLQPGSANVEITGVTGEQLLSGEIAYKLGSAWGQTIGTDDYPIPGGRKVYYGYADCKATEKTYANSPMAETELVHSFNANGFCSVCDEYEPASDAEADGYYEIDNAGKLYWFAAQVNGGNTAINGKLIENITVNENVLNANGEPNSGDFRAWTPIGKSGNNYTGTFDGNGKTISGLYFNDSTTNYVGLFGIVSSGTVQNVGVIDSYLHGNKCVGGVVGYNSSSGTVQNCYNTGSVSGTSYYVGGVVGYNYGTVTGCYNTGSVSGTYYVGGVVGWNSSGTVQNSYNTGSVSGTGYYVGGVVGHNSSSGTVKDCYNTGTVSGDQNVGGVVGYNSSSTVQNCYNTGSVSGDQNVGGVVGYNSGSIIVSNCYYDSSVYSGNAIGNSSGTITNVLGKTTEQFASGEVAYLLNGDQSTIVFKQTIGTDAAPGFTGETVYAITNCVGTGTGAYSNTKTQLPHDYSNNNGFCTVCDAYEPATDSDSNGYYDIDNAGKLYWFAAQVNSGYTNINGELKANIVVNENVLTADGELNGDGSEFRLWTPIGTGDNGYSGDFCGLEHTVSGLYFNDSTANLVGLFGYVGSGEVNYVGVIDSYFNGSGAVGGVVGCNYGTVEYAYNTGTVKGDASVGGVVGDNYSTVKYAYNTGTVSGDFVVGGVVGSNEGTVMYAYNTGSVSGGTDVGGVAGENYDTFATATNCYFDSTVYTGTAIGTDSGTATDVEGKTTEQFASGEVAYLLGSHFGQTIGTHSSPVLDGDEVYYGYTSCGDVQMVYTNDSSVSAEKPSHDYDNGFCTRCHGYEPAVLNGDVYEISNAGNLYWFAAKVNAGETGINGRLTTEITVNEGTMTAETTDARAWTPIGTESGPYTGTFDGGEHTISGLYFNDSTAYYVGLFGSVAEGGTVENVTVSDTYFCGNWYVGGLVGLNNGTVKNCTNEGTVSGTVSVGGVVGDNYGTVENCRNSGTVSGTVSVGGVVGDNYGTAENCNNIGTVSGDSPVGGVAGYNSGTVDNCKNSGDVSGKTNVGGVVGDNLKAGTVENCNNIGTVSGQTNVGGVEGSNYGTMENCSNRGTVSGARYVGGVAGRINGTVTNCYNGGTVSGSIEYVGGVVGYNSKVLSTSSAGTVTNCYFDSTVCTGNAIGSNDGTATDVEGKTTDQFKSGEVAYLLSQGENGSIWGQSIGTEDYPVLGGKTVYCGYTSCGDVQMVYTNDPKASTEKPEHTGEVTYTPSADGAQHIASYSCCGSQVIQDHTYENGKCVCGAYDLWVAGEQITDSHRTVTGTTGTATYDPATDTLTLNGFDNDFKSYSFTNNESSINAAVYTMSDLNVVLTGENCLGTEGFGLIMGIWSDAALTIGGDGAILSCPLYSANGTIITGGTLDILGVHIAFDGPSTTINGGSVNVSVNQSVTFGTLTVNGGRVVLENSSFDMGYGVGFGSTTTIVIGEGMAVYDANGDLIKNPDFKNLEYVLIQATCDHSGSEHTAATDNGNGTHSFICTLCGNTGTQDHSFPEGSNGFCLCDAYESAVLNGDVYEISNAGQLYWFMDQMKPDKTVNGKLMKNITVNENVLTEMEKDTPDTSSFRTWNSNLIEYTGTFDGNGKTVSGLYFNDSSADAVGLFGRVAAGGTVQNLTVSDSYICGNGGVGGIAAYNYGTVSNCSYDGTVIGSIAVGGIAGHNEGTLENCSSEGTVTATYNGVSYVGGVVGENYWPGTVKNCTNKARVTGAQFVGGVVGENRGSITLCHNEADVTGNDTVGGVAGNNYTIDTSYATVTLCTNAGSVLAGPEYGNREYAGSAGGIVGLNGNGSTVEKCSNEGSVTATGEGSYNVGGIVAVNSGTVTNCGNEGSVSGAEWVGGVVGSNSSGSVTNSYNIGTVTCTSYGGGGVTGNDSNNVKDCYYLDTAATGGIDGTDYQGQAEARTEAQFKSGEVAYLLGNAWGQTIGTEDVPVLGGKQVYPVTNCGNQIVGYTNTQTSGEPQHSYGDPVYSWTEDPTTLTVTLECTVCSQDVEGHTLRGSTTDMDVTTSADGFTTTYTASVVLNGETYTASEQVTNEVKRVEITWGSMEFTYTEDENGEGAWGNADNANLITVKNTGNAAVAVTATYNRAAGYDEIRGIIDASGTNTHTETAEAATTVKFYLGLEGEPKKALKDAVVGTVTVSIQ